MNGWSAKTEPLPSGVLLTVTSSDTKQVDHIRGLGFIGLLTSGAHIRSTIWPWPRASSRTNIRA